MGRGTTGIRGKGLRCCLLAVALGPFAVPGNAPPSFEEISARSGLNAVLNNAATADKHQVETMAGGIAVIDFDRDGRPDVFVTNGAPQPGLVKDGPQWWNRLYRNRGDGTFADVTARAGLAGQGFSIAAAVADFDNDGWPDLFVAGVGRNILYRNRGDGTFEDVTAKARIPQTGWAVGAAFFDADGDGWLDLFIVNYVHWDPLTEPQCGELGLGIRTYCHPRFFQGLPNTLLRNNRDGSFTDVSRESGIAAHVGKGMGIAIGDYDNDGRIDVFVANDTLPNFLFHNEGGMRFKEAALESGVALNDDGRALSSMGVDFRDIDNDGRDDLFVTSLANETFPLYRNRGGGLFQDLTYLSRLGHLSVAYSGWGAGVFDFDLDGRKDIFTANGDVNDNSERFSSQPSRQRCHVFWQREPLRFEAEEVGETAQYRGAAFADFNEDGRIDVVLSRLGQPPALLLNRAGQGRHWVAFDLEGTRSNRDAIGARLHLITTSGEQWNRCTTAVGYASASEKPVRFGLGSNPTITAVEIEWPSGVKQRIQNPAPDHVIKVREPE